MEEEEGQGTALSFLPAVPKLGSWRFAARVCLQQRLAETFGGVSRPGFRSRGAFAKRCLPCAWSAAGPKKVPEGKRQRCSWEEPVVRPACVPRPCGRVRS